MAAILKIIIGYLKRYKTSTVIWLGTILLWIFYILGWSFAGNGLLIAAVTIFCLIMARGQEDDKLRDANKELEKFRI